MAPNVPVPVPQSDDWEGSEVSSQEAEVMVDPLPEVFVPHLPQHFQDPDSPNLHMLQSHDFIRSTQKPTARSQTARSTLRALRQPTGAPAREQSDGVFHPSRVSVLDLTNSDRRNTDTTHLRPQNTARPQQETTAAPSGVPSQTNGGFKKSDDLSPLPFISPGDTIMAETHDQNFKPMISVSAGSSGASPTRGEGRAMGTTTRPTTMNTAKPKKLDPGFLKLPGHEPEAPADLVLVHHDRAIDTRNQTGLNGIYVKDESSDVSPEGESVLLFFVLQNTL